MKKLQIGVIGWAGLDEYPKQAQIPKQTFLIAERIGELVAKNNAILITGGKGGIMSAASRGAKKCGGITIGVIRGTKRFQSNQYTDIELLTGASGIGLDEYLLVNISDVLIVLGGGAGTLQEITLAYRNNKPVIIVQNCGGWGEKLIGKTLDERKKQIFRKCTSAERAVKKALSLAKRSLHANSSF